MNLYFINQVSPSSTDLKYAVEAEVKNKVEGRLFYWLKKNLKKETWAWEWSKQNGEWHTYFFKRKLDAVWFMMCFGGLDEETR